MFGHACDDGNVIDGDGCSSNCSIEKDYRCNNGSATSASVCTFSGRYLKLQFKNITKSNIQNRLIFTFTLWPPIFTIPSNISNISSLKTSVPLSVVNTTYNQGVISV